MQLIKTCATHTWKGRCDHDVVVLEDDGGLFDLKQIMTDEIRDMFILDVETDERLRLEDMEGPDVETDLSDFSEMIKALDDAKLKEYWQYDRRFEMESINSRQRTFVWRDGEGGLISLSYTIL